MANFGWSYPAGCESVPGDEYDYCEMCGKNCDGCICPECPTCGEVGNPHCYTQYEGEPGKCAILEETQEQRDSRAIA